MAGSRRAEPFDVRHAHVRFGVRRGTRMGAAVSLFLDDGDVKLYQGDALEVLRSLPDGCVDMVATSPPFYGLRDYGSEGQIGLEETPDQWVTNLVAVFRECRRVLADHGTLWVEIGDSYAANRTYQVGDTIGAKAKPAALDSGSKVPAGMKQKDLLGQPWMLAFALRADGWYLRSEIIWARPNPMPESVTDRPTKAHSTVFLFAKGGKWKSRVVECSNLPSECLHLGADLSAKSPDLVAGDFSVRLATAILDCAKSHDDLGLRPLDSEIGQEQSASVSGASVADLPVEHWAAVLASRLLLSEIPPKEFLCELHRRGVALTDGDQLLIGDGLPLVPLPPGVTRYGETAIAVHHPGEVRQLDLRHNRIIVSTPPSSCSYFYDADAIREPHARLWNSENNGGSMATGRHDAAHLGGSKRHERPYPEPNPSGANARSVWNIPTEPTPFAHFATWPRKLVARMILAGTSERGKCGVCGKPWVRDIHAETANGNPVRRRPPPLGGWLKVQREALGIKQGEVARHFPSRTGGLTGCVSNWENDKNVPTAEQWEVLRSVLGFGHERDADLAAWHEYERSEWGTTPDPLTHGAPSAAPAHLARRTLREEWVPSCDCDVRNALEFNVATPPAPCVILDPFAGSGTTLLVARHHGRHAIGIELNSDYLKIAADRLSQLSLLTGVTDD